MRQGDSIVHGTRDGSRRRSGVGVRGVRLVAAAVDRHRARSAQADHRCSSGHNLHVSGGRDVAARRARRTARLQRHDGHLLFRTGRLSPRPGQAGARGRAGDGSMITTCSRAIVALSLAAATSGCGGTTPSAEVSAAAPPEAKVSSNDPAAVHLTASQLARVRVEEIAADASAGSIKATGTVEFNADRMAKILPPVSGQVQSLAVNVGDAVRKNDVLFVLSSREVAAAVADHLTSHKDLELAEKTFAMTQDLYEHQAASRIALQQSESELAKAKSKVTQTEEVLEVIGRGPDAADTP